MNHFALGLLLVLFACSTFAEKPHDEAKKPSRAMASEQGVDVLIPSVPDRGCVMPTREQMTFVKNAAGKLVLRVATGEGTLRDFDPATGRQIAEVADLMKGEPRPDRYVDPKTGWLAIGGRSDQLEGVKIYDPSEQKTVSVLDLPHRRDGGDRIGIRFLDKSRVATIHVDQVMIWDITQAKARRIAVTYAMKIAQPFGGIRVRLDEASGKFEVAGYGGNPEKGIGRQVFDPKTNGFSSFEEMPRLGSALTSLPYRGKWLALDQGGFYAEPFDTNESKLLRLFESNATPVERWPIKYKGMDKVGPYFVLHEDGRSTFLDGMFDEVGVLENVKNQLSFQSFVSPDLRYAVVRSTPTDKDGENFCGFQIRALRTAVHAVGFDTKSIGPALHSGDARLAFRALVASAASTELKEAALAHRPVERDVDLIAAANLVHGPKGIDSDRFVTREAAQREIVKILSQPDAMSHAVALELRKLLTSPDGKGGNFTRVYYPELAKKFPALLAGRIEEILEIKTERIEALKALQP